MVAKLVNWNLIETDFNIDDKISLFIDNEEVEINIDNRHISFDYNKEILGKNIILKFANNSITVSVKEVPLFKDFDDHYSYEEDDLGSLYFPTYTKFNLWAPLAKSVSLRIDDKIYPLIRSDRGVFRITINEDLDGKLYDYLILIDDEEIISIDPYGKSSNSNAEKSAVINLKKLDINTYSNCLSEFNNYVEAVIYEAHIRDFTIHQSTNIENKGKYLGLVEEVKKSKQGNPVGIDYLKQLGITHLQLLPVLDFGSVDEIKLDKYNWGYDPMQFFALEGSYSLNPNDPYSRMIEFKKLIAGCHKNNIRVNLDVVYNHVYKIKEFSLEKITPNYFFRFKNGKLTDHSGCGNDFCSERFMSRKFIIDSALFLLNTYDIDGFRFDLMGLLDVDTINILTQKVKKIKPNAMIYGEGWDMYIESEYGAKFANYKNANILNNVAFFNDTFRNIVRGAGSTSKLESNGYLLGNSCYYDGFNFAYLGCTSDYPFPHLYNNLNQTLNYVECHDNATIYDVISDSLNFEEKDRLIKLFNKVILLSPGIPFIHMGQEYGLSKKSHYNTYNEGDLYNQFNPDIMDKRYDLVKSFIGYVELRKSIDLLRQSESFIIKDNVSFSAYNGVLDIKLNTNNIYHILINVSDKKKDLDDERFKNMELVVPPHLKSFDERVLAYNMGIGPFKCLIFKE